MKDWMKECIKLKSEIKVLENELQWLRDELSRRNDRDAQFRDKFRELLIDTLEKSG